MKLTLIAIAALLVGFMPTSSVTFSDVRGTPESDSISLQWSTSQEDGIRDFVVEKASQLDNNFYEISGRIPAAGAGTVYQYSDKAIYKTTSSSLFKYRIRAEGIDGSITYSSTISVSYNFSSSLSGVARRTWGSIKAMFR